MISGFILGLIIIEAPFFCFSILVLLWYVETQLPMDTAGTCHC